MATNLPMVDIEAGQSSTNHLPAATSQTSSHEATPGILSWALFPYYWLRRRLVSQICSPEEAVTPSRFIYAQETWRYRKGLPRLAADQNAYENFSMRRKFGYLLHRCLIDSQADLTSAEQHLYALEHPTSAAHPSPPGFWVSTDDAEDGRQQQQEQQHSVVSLKEISVKLREYYELTFYETKLGSLHEVTYPEFRNTYDKIRNDGYLDEEGMAYLNYPSDFVDTGSDPLWLVFKAWIYRIYPFLPTALFKNKNSTTEENSDLLSTPGARFVYRSLFIWVCACILLVPVMLFYLLPALSKEATSCLLVGFTFVFTALMACHRDVKSENILIGACAYAAVLVAFLANLQGDAQKP